MIDLDKILYFSCPDECGQIAVPCSLRMILNNETFFCEACGCEFQASLFPDWLKNATSQQNHDDQISKLCISLYAYLYANGSCPDEESIGRILKSDLSLWVLFPPAKLSAADILQLLDDHDFASRFKFSELTGRKICDLLILRPDLASKCNMKKLTSTNWLRLIRKHGQFISQCPANLPWDKLTQADWDKILENAGTDYAKTLYNITHGKEIAQSLIAYPELKRYIKWESIDAKTWLKLLADLPEYASQCPWEKIYDYIENLSAKQRQSMKSKFPELWNRRLELLSYVDIPELQKLSADKYYSVLDFFDWEDVFDFSSMSSEERIDLFSKHPQFGKRFGWEKLSSEEKVMLAMRSLEFCRDYGWKNFSKDEILYILNEKPNYLRYFDLSKFDKSFFRNLANQNEVFAKYYKLNFADYLLFRKFNSKKLCSKITSSWHFIISIITFTGFGYFMFEGPCGFRSLLSESHERAVSSAIFYCATAILWSYLHSWLFSGRTPFLLTISSAVLGGLVAAIQYGYTFFLSKITLSNYISIGVLIVLILSLIIAKALDCNGELCRSNTSGFKILGIFYFPIILLTIAICQPCVHWQFLKVSNQITNSSRPFRSAAQYYLQKAFVSDTNTKKIITDLKSSIEYADYDNCKKLFEKIPQAYRSFSEIKKFEEKVQIVIQKQVIKYTKEAIEAYNEKDYQRMRSVIYKADPQNAEIQFILGKCNHLGLGGHKIKFEDAVVWYKKAVAQNHARAMNNLANLYMDGHGVQKSVTKALELYKSSAQADYAIAQRNLAFLYLNGKVVPKNLMTAYNWFLKAAKLNDAVSQRQVALMSYLKMGIQRNDKEITIWLTKAAEQGDAVAQQMLGAFYLTGVLGKQDYEIAVTLLKKSAKQNNISAQSILGLCYVHGKGVKTDAAQAILWLTKAAEKNDSTAQYALFELYYSGKIIEKNPEKALHWLKKAALNNPAAQYNLGVCYWNGDMVKHDAALAEHWLQKAYSNGYSKAKATLEQIKSEIKRKKQEERTKAYENARNKSKDFFQKGQYKEALYWGLKSSPKDYEILCNIAAMYFNGWGIEQNTSKAMEYAKQAAAGNYPKGYYLLAWCYDRQKNMQKAFQYYKKSAELGYVDGQYDVGCCYIFGQGCSVNYSQAHYWFSKAAKQNHAGAENNLGQMYLKGHGVKKNKNLAKKWFQRAAAHGSKNAKKTLLSL